MQIDYSRLGVYFNKTQQEIVDIILKTAFDFTTLKMYHEDFLKELEDHLLSLRFIGAYQVGENHLFVYKPKYGFAYEMRFSDTTRVDNILSLTRPIDKSNAESYVLDAIDYLIPSDVWNLDFLKDCLPTFLIDRIAEDKLTFTEALTCYAKPKVNVWADKGNEVTCPTLIEAWKDKGKEKPLGSNIV